MNTLEDRRVQERSGVRMSKALVNGVAEEAFINYIRFIATESVEYSSIQQIFCLFYDLSKARVACAVSICYSFGCLA